jgi:hypothetical protein
VACYLTLLQVTLILYSLFSFISFNIKLSLQRFLSFYISFFWIFCRSGSMIILRAPVVCCGRSTRVRCPMLASTRQRRGRRMRRMQGCYLIGSSCTTSHGGPMRIIGMSSRFLSTLSILVGIWMGRARPDIYLIGSCASLDMCRASCVIKRIVLLSWPPFSRLINNGRVTCNVCWLQKC